MSIVRTCYDDITEPQFAFDRKDEEPVDYPMGVRQAATIVFPDPVGKKLSEKEASSGKEEGDFGILAEWRFF